MIMLKHAIPYINYITVYFKLDSCPAVCHCVYMLFKLDFVEIKEAFYVLSPASGLSHD